LLLSEGGKRKRKPAFVFRKGEEKNGGGERVLFASERVEDLWLIVRYEGMGIWEETQGHHRKKNEAHGLICRIWHAKGGKG